MMTTALLLQLALGGWEHLPADGGAAELTIIDSDASTGVLLVTFNVGFGDDHGLGGLTAQAQSLLTHANRALEVDRFGDAAFARGLSLSRVLGRSQAHYILSGPRSAVEDASPQLLQALFNPRIDGAAYAGLAARGGGEPDLANSTELMLAQLEPLVLEDQRRLTVTKFRWQSLERLKQHLDEFFRPANASVTLVGLDAARLKPLVLRARGGARRQFASATFAKDVRLVINSRHALHIFGYPLPPLGATEVAGMRVISRALRAHLLGTLRERGEVYDIVVENQLTPTFRGVFLALPAFNDSGLELEPLLTQLIADVVHRKFDAAELAELVAAVRYEDALARASPVALADSLVRGRREAVWDSPEYLEALATLTPEELQRVVSQLFVNERRRFYLEFRPGGRR